MTKKLINEYIEKCRKHLQDELNDFIEMNTLKEVIERAAMAINSKNKKFSHQYRLTDKALTNAKNNLLKKISKIENIKDFDELYTLIKGSTEDIKGVGILYYYDISLRIGAFLNTYPDKIYLHRGSLEGARNFNININKAKIINKDNLTDEFRELECFEIESFLCIFKNKLHNITSKC